MAAKITPRHGRYTLPNGFPVYAVVKWYPAEPDVGIMESYPEVDDIVVKDKKGRVKWFWRALTRDEIVHITEQDGQ